MGRLISTEDLRNRLQAYGEREQDGFGIFRGKILGVVENVIMDCPTVEAVPKGRYDDLIDRVLETIEKNEHIFFQEVLYTRYVKNERVYFQELYTRHTDLVDFVNRLCRDILELKGSE